jgi:hypothetical protein
MVTLRVQVLHIYTYMLQVSYRILFALDISCFVTAIVYQAGGLFCPRLGESLRLNYNTFEAARCDRCIPTDYQTRLRKQLPLCNHQDFLL